MMVSSEKQLSKLILYSSNRQGFIKMLNCLDIKDGDEFTLDFPKFAKFQNEEKNFAWSEHEPIVNHNLKKA
jgi:hypothetical protein